MIVSLEVEKLCEELLGRLLAIRIAIGGIYNMFLVLLNSVLVKLEVVKLLYTVKQILGSLSVDGVLLMDTTMK